MVAKETDIFARLRSFVTELLPATRMRQARSGAEAMDYIEGKGFYSNRYCYPFPDLLLLDPFKVGVDDLLTLVGWIKDREEFWTVPVVVLGRNRNELFTQLTYDAGANSFLVGREDLAQLGEIICSIQEWKEMLASPGVESEMGKERACFSI